MIGWLKNWWREEHGYYDECDVASLAKKFDAAEPGEAVWVTPREMNAARSVDPGKWYGFGAPTTPRR